MPTKIDSVPVYDNQFQAVKVDGVVQKELGRDVYFRNLPPEKQPQNDEPVYLISTELFQSVNPFLGSGAHACGRRIFCHAGTAKKGTIHSY